MEVVGGFLILFSIVTGTVSFIGLFKRIPSLWLPTRTRSIRVWAVSVLLFGVGAAMLPDPSPPATPTKNGESLREEELEENHWRDTANLSNAFFELTQEAPPEEPSEWYLGLSADSQTTLAQKTGLGKVIRDSFGRRLITGHIRTSSLRHEGVEGKKIVEVRFMGSEGFTADSTKRGMELHTIDGCEALFNAGFPILRVKITAFLPLIDRLGNETLGRVYSTELGQDIGSKVNWKNKDKLDFTEVWETTYLHPSFM